MIRCNRRTVGGLAVGFFVLVALASGASAQSMAISLQTSRTSGVAPLAVFFDAVDTLHTDPNIEPFSELGYGWDFGDAGAGNWSTDGTSKNSARGPVAAHVFDQPGSYTVTLTVEDPSRNVMTRSVTINVTDPNNVYVGSQTVCVSSTGNFTGCPTAAQQVNQADFDTAVASYVGTNRRVLFRRGDTFQASQSNFFNLPGPVTIGAFGTGNRPIVQLTNGIGSAGVIQLSGRVYQVRDWRIMDLDMRSNFYDGEMPVSGSGHVDDLLVQRLAVTDFPNGPGFYGSILRYDQVPVHNGLFLVDLNISRSRPPPLVGSYPITLCGFHSALLGTTSTNVGSPTHVLRIDHMKRSVVQHNDLRDPSPTRQVLKLHNAWGTGVYTEYVVLSENHFHGGATSWNSSLGPQDTTSDERLRRILVENNYFTFGTTGFSRIGLLVAADETVVRNNIFNHAGDNEKSMCIQLRRAGAEPMHFGTRAEHNTCYDPDATSSPTTAVDVYGNNNSEIRGNLLVATLPNQFTGPADAILANNLAMTASPFVSAAPALATGFALRSGTSAVDAAPSSLTAPYDFRGAPRRQDGDGNGSAIADVGALEIAGGTGGPPPPVPQPPAAPVLLP